MLWAEFKLFIAFYVQVSALTATRIRLVKTGMGVSLQH